MSDSPIDIELERSFYYGIIMTAILYGLEAYMFFHSVYLVANHSKGVRVTQMSYIFIGALMMVLVTISRFTNVVFLEFMWIDYRDAEGGPLGYFTQNSSIWWQTLGTLADQVTNFLGDGLLIYRLYIISGGNIYLILFPVILFLGSIGALSPAMALVTTVQSAIPGSNFFRGQAVNFGVPWAALSVTLNVVCTTTIIYRILRVRQQMRQVSDFPVESLSTYTGIVAMLVESSLPFSTFGIIFAVTYGKGLPVGVTFAFIWGVLSALSPQFIIYRVAMGRAWTRDVASQVSRLDFANHITGDSTNFSSEGPVAEVKAKSSATLVMGSSV